LNGGTYLLPLYAFMLWREKPICKGLNCVQYMGVTTFRVGAKGLFSLVGLLSFFLVDITINHLSSRHLRYAVLATDSVVTQHTLESATFLCASLSFDKCSIRISCRSLFQSIASLNKNTSLVLCLSLSLAMSVSLSLSLSVYNYCDVRDT
jgi:hypothetical protein